jgi:hypothetical protein
MLDTGKLHSVKSKSISLKEAAELLRNCPDEKKRARIALMRETARDIVRLLAELEAELPGV